MLSLGFAPTLASAQAPPVPRFDSFDRPGDERLEVPEPATSEPPDVDLPPVLPPSEAEGALLSGLPRIVVREVRVAGSSVFSEDQLARVAAPYLGRPVGSEELVELRDRLTQLYVNAGYVSSGAQLPDQEVRDGVVEYRIVEGHLAELGVEGNRWLRDGYLIRRLERGAGTPLDVAVLERELQLLQEDARIRRLNAVLLPGERPGDARLRVRVEEESPFSASLTADNHESPSIGAYHGQLALAHHSLTKNGDVLHARAGATDGLVDYEIGYELPLTRWDTSLAAWYSAGESDVVEAPFASVDIASESRTVGVQLRQPILRDRASQLELALGFEYRESETFLLGQPFPFAPGTDDGRSRVAVLRFSQDYVRRDQTQVIALRSQLSFGLDALDATKNGGDLPDGQFVAWLAQLQWVRRFGALEWIARTDLQLASSRLLSLEQFSVGGSQSVRGYRENQLVSDDGALVSLELRIPLWQSRASAVQLAPFVDAGWAWNEGPRGSRTLASAGLGLRVELGPHLRGELFWGQRLKDVAKPADRDLQDSGVHFQITAAR